MFLKISGLRVMLPPMAELNKPLGTAPILALGVFTDGTLFIMVSANLTISGKGMTLNSLVDSVMFSSDVS